jgi:HSP20 family molecular chaperone IbpA
MDGRTGPPSGLRSLQANAIKGIEPDRLRLKEVSGRQGAAPNPAGEIMRSTNGYLVRTSRDPFREFDSLVRTAFGAPATAGPSAPFSPAVESHREGDDAVIRLEVPGLDIEKDVTVEVKGRVLVVAGERRDERVEVENGRHLSEFRYGSFRRTFRLGPQVTAEAVTASYDAGVLTVRVAGAYAETQGQKVEITSGKPGEPTVEGEVTEAHQG